ncbi:response regulator, partial [Staphylococcus epidermidis]
MDINLGGLNGYEWCEEIGKVCSVGIIFISWGKESMDEVMGMEMGGDDLIEKGFNMSVTISKIEGVLGRRYDLRSEVNNLRVDDWELVVDGGKVKFNEERIEVRQSELEMMDRLLEKK